MTFIIVEHEQKTIDTLKEIITTQSRHVDAKTTIEVFANYSGRLHEIIKDQQKPKIYFINVDITTPINMLSLAAYIRKNDLNSNIFLFTRDDSKHQEIDDLIPATYRIINPNSDYETTLIKDIAKISEILLNTKRFIYHTPHNTLSISLNAITYISRDKEERKLIIHTDLEEFRINMTFSNLKQILDKRFKMSHRACLINTDRVVNYDWQHKEIIIDSGVHIPYLSKKYKETLLSEF